MCRIYFLEIQIDHEVPPLSIDDPSVTRFHGCGMDKDDIYIPPQEVLK